MFIIANSTYSQLFPDFASGNNLSACRSQNTIAVVAEVAGQSYFNLAIFAFNATTPTKVTTIQTGKNSYQCLRLSNLTDGFVVSFVSFANYRSYVSFMIFDSNGTIIRNTKDVNDTKDYAYVNVLGFPNGNFILSMITSDLLGSYAQVLDINGNAVSTIFQTYVLNTSQWLAPDYTKLLLLNDQTVCFLIELCSGSNSYQSYLVYYTQLGVFIRSVCLYSQDVMPDYQFRSSLIKMQSKLLISIISLGTPKYYKCLLMNQDGSGNFKWENMIYPFPTYSADPANIVLPIFDYNYLHIKTIKNIQGVENTIVQSSFRIGLDLLFFFVLPMSPIKVMDALFVADDGEVKIFVSGLYCVCCLLCW